MWKLKGIDGQILSVVIVSEGLSSVETQANYIESQITNVSFRRT